tara:strand:- start:554 stop:2050 length:1497 start_codon:yes stop_codon:yes gene_type:complete
MSIKKLIHIYLFYLFLIPSLSATMQNEDEIKYNSLEKLFVEQSKIEKKEFLEFKDLKDILIKNNKEIKILMNQINQSKANYKGKLSSWYPKVYLNSNDLPKYNIGNNYKNQNDDTSTNKLTFGLNINIDYDIINPQRRLEIKIAEEELINSNNLLTSKINDLYLETTNFFYYIQAAYQEINVARKSLEISNIALSEAEGKYNSGIGNKLDLLEAQTQLDRDQIKLVEVIGKLNKNKNSLFLILNTGDKYDVKENKKSLIKWFWDSSVDESLTAAYKNRLDLRIKNQDISINDKKSLSVLSGKKPNFTFYNQYSLSKSWGENDVTTNPKFENENKTINNSFGIKFNWNLFDGGLIKQNYISLKNRTEELKNELNLSRNQIKKQLVDSFIDLDISKQNIMYSFNQLKAAKETLIISLKRLNAGLTTQREVVNIQADVAEAESNFINSITEYNISLAELERLTLIDKKNICSLRTNKENNIVDDFYNFLNENGLNKSCVIL